MKEKDYFRYYLLQKLAPISNFFPRVSVFVKKLRNASSFLLPDNGHAVPVVKRELDEAPAEEDGDEV